MSIVYYRSRTAELYGVTSALLVIATAAVILRLLSRRVSSASFWWDDWTILAALVNPTCALDPLHYDLALCLPHSKILFYGLTSCFWVQAGIGGLGRRGEATDEPMDQERSVRFYKVRHYNIETFQCWS